MPSDRNSARERARATYAAASDSFDDAANAYWERYGRRTVERIPVREGASVLDVACGTGASALPAAELAGPKGSVLGVDLSDPLLAIAREKARERHLDNVRFVNADMSELPPKGGRFDAIVCVFGIFFVPDMESLVARLWTRLADEGRLAITTWGPNLFEPLYSVFDDAVRTTRPDLVSEYRPWDRLTEPSALRSLLEMTGSHAIAVEAEAGSQPLETPDNWWQIVRGSGLRFVLDALSPNDAKRVRRKCMAYIEKNAVDSVTTNVVYGVATKSSG